jgi:hypothetical protein
MVFSSDFEREKGDGHLINLPTPIERSFARALVEQMRTVARDEDLDGATRRRHYADIEKRIWSFFEKGELDAPHQGMLLDVLHRSAQMRPEPVSGAAEDDR